MTMPSGRGWWVWDLRNIGSIEVVIEQATAANCTHVLLKGGDGPAFWAHQMTEANVRKLKDAGLGVYAWTYGYGGTSPGSAHAPREWSIDDEIAVARQVIAVPGLDGFVVDVEAEWRDQMNAAATAERFAAAVREMWSGFFAYSPVPVIDYHLHLPYVQFNAVCDAVLPQFYCRALGWSFPDLLEQWTRWEATWRANGYRVPPILPAGETFGAAGYDDVIAFERAATPFGAWSYWELGQARPEHLAAFKALDSQGSPVSTEPGNPPNAETDPVTDSLNGIWQRLAEAETAVRLAREEVIELKKALNKEAA